MYNITGVMSVDQSGSVGLKNGRLLYSPAEDMRFFRDLTNQKDERGDDAIIVMGGKTYESLDQELEGRQHVVFCRSREEFYQKNFEKVSTETWLFDDPDKLAEWVIKQQENGRRIFFIGGAYLIEEFMWLIDEFYLTVFDQVYRGTNKVYMHPYLFTWTGPRVRWCIGSHPGFQRYRLEPPEKDREIRKQKWPTYRYKLGSGPVDLEHVNFMG